MKNSIFSKAKRISIIILLGVVMPKAYAQHNFYHRIDVGSSNIYTFVVSNLITGYTNYFTHDMLFDNSFDYAFTNASVEGKDLKTKAYNPMGLTAKDLFNDAYAGVKLGYQSDNPGSFNWGIYASAHYKINQFRVGWTSDDVLSAERAQYFKPGAGLLFTFGSIEQKSKVQLEAALRYDIPLAYKGYFGEESGTLNSGLSSHFALKFVGYRWVSAGLYTDINHYNLYKSFDDLGNKSKFNLFNIGITFTITPKRGEDIH